MLAHKTVFFSITVHEINMFSQQDGNKIAIRRQEARLEKTEKRFPAKFRAFIGRHTHDADRVRMQ